MPAPTRPQNHQAMDHADHHHAFLCDGSHHSGTGGSWIGHFLPGLFLSAWGLHWFLSVCAQHLRHRQYAQQYTLLPVSSSTANGGSTGSGTRGRIAEADGQRGSGGAAAAPATHRLVVVEPRGLNLEAWLKVILPVIGIYLEFKLSGTRCALLWSCGVLL